MDPIISYYIQLCSYTYVLTYPDPDLPNYCLTGIFIKCSFPKVSSQSSFTGWSCLHSLCFIKWLGLKMFTIDHLGKILWVNISNHATMQNGVSHTSVKSTRKPVILARKWVESPFWDHLERVKIVKICKIPNATRSSSVIESVVEVSVA